MKQRMSITVRGRRKEWNFEFKGDERYLSEWREDGLRVNEVLNTVPESVAEMGLTRVWCFAQDAYVELKKLIFGFTDVFR